MDLRMFCCTWLELEVAVPVDEDGSLHVWI